MLSDATLFTPLIEEGRFHPYFKVLNKTEYEEERKVLIDWSDKILERDGKEKFTKEFQSSFNSCFWELYLNALFYSWNLKMDYSKPHPDFIIEDYDGICVESVIAENEQGGIPEYVNAGKEFDSQFHIDFGDSSQVEEFIRKSVIRLSNALITKLKKYNESYSRESYVSGKPFVIAVSPFDRPDFWCQSIEAIQQLLYGFKNINLSVNEIQRCNYEMIPSVQKDNGSEIPLGFFDNSEWDCVSAVIFSTTATFSKVQALSKSNSNGQFFIYSRYNEDSTTFNGGFVKKDDYNETLDDGIQIFINPKAKYPLPEHFVELFPVVSYGFCNKNPIMKVKNGALLYRTQQGFKIFDEMSPTSS